jgi:ferredoxin-NADP reductase
MPTFFQAGLSVIEGALDRTGMYRVVTSALGVLALWALCAGALQYLPALEQFSLPYTPLEQGISLILALGAALATQFLIARAGRMPVHYESAIITALIIHFLVVPPPLASGGQWVVAVVATLAVLSKFVIAWRKQHLANPAAMGAVLTSLLVAGVSTDTFETGWWIGSPVLFVPLLIAGGMVVAKVRALAPVGAFLGVGFLVFLLEEFHHSGDVVSGAEFFWLSGPAVFLAAFMLTEPFTLPPTRRLRMVYGAVIGALANTTLFAPFVSITPELALVAGNFAFFGYTVRQKLYLTLVSRRLLADATYEFVFKKPAGFTFRAGQYLEWMLPHATPDSRGTRRYFTIAASPTEPDVRLALRVPKDSSTYKQALLALKPDSDLIGSQLAGDFVLPHDREQKLAFVAGGIGVTPFRSHLAYLANTGTKHDIILFYCNNSAAEIAYRDEFTHFASVLPLRVVQVLAKEAGSGPEFEQGFLTREIIERRTPDYRERLWYLSGPPGMVKAYEKLLRELGVPRRQIVKDFFPGLA